ncbi:MAG: hypothetical protein ACLFUR_00750 [Candidatus Hadarchaeia archaeon]
MEGESSGRSLEKRVTALSDRVDELENRIDELEDSKRSKKSKKVRKVKKSRSGSKDDGEIKTDHSYLKKTISDAKKRYNEEHNR